MEHPEENDGGEFVNLNFGKVIPGASPKSQSFKKNVKPKKQKVLRIGDVSPESGTKISVVMGDITDESSTAIVCSANPFLDF